MTSDRERVQRLMAQIMVALHEDNGEIPPSLAIPALLYMTGFIIANTKPADMEMEAVLRGCLEDIAYGIQTVDAIAMTINTINKAKGD
jgi:hypothetical protein